MVLRMFIMLFLKGFYEFLGGVLVVLSAFYGGCDCLSIGFYGWSLRGVMVF